MPNMSGLPVLDSDWRLGGHPNSPHLTKDLQDGPPTMELGNGPKQGESCWRILTPLLEGFVQFYLGTWLLKRGAYPSHMEGQWSHEAGW